MGSTLSEASVIKAKKDHSVLCPECPNYMRKSTTCIVWSRKFQEKRFLYERSSIAKSTAPLSLTVTEDIVAQTLVLTGQPVGSLNNFRNGYRMQFTSYLLGTDGNDHNE